MWDRLESMRARYEELSAEMGRPEIAKDFQRLDVLAREHTALGKIIEIADRYRKVAEDLSGAQALSDEGGDEDMAAMINEEIEQKEKEVVALENELRRALIPRDPYDEKDVIVEIRAAAGGEEASLFAGDLFRMYSRYAERQNWKTEIIESHSSDLGGFRDIVFEVQGRGAYSRLKFESGVHRVQRVPETEAQGRIHTSTITVAVLPVADEVDIDIDQKDLRMDFYNAGGAGGQNVQKNDNAVRITHIPTGIVATCQDERSQLKNKTKAMAVLRARLLDIKQREQREEIEESRRTQVGSGDRAEKIRTYNYPQDRMTDHRINYTRHSLPVLLDGDMEDVIEALQQHEQKEILEAQLA